MNRPNYNDNIRHELSRILGKEIFDWCNGETPLESCITDCYDTFDYYPDDNGYELARNFEDMGYSPDIDLVAILDMAWTTSRNLIDKAVKEWVIENDIKPQLEIDSECIVKYGFKKEKGIITDIKYETAEYLVCIPSEGMSIENNRRRAVIKYENAESIEAAINN